MRKISNKTYKENLREIFYQIRIHPWYQRIILLPFWVKWCMSIFLFLFGIVGLLTPIPAGWVMIMTAGVLIF